MQSVRKLLLGATFALVPGLAHADDVDVLGQRLVEVEARIRELDVQLKPEEARPEAAARRLIDGQVLYELKNYEGAATIFLDVVEKYPSAPEHADALYYLADSLYLHRDFLSSRRYYEKSVELGPSGPHYQESLERLIELSLYTGDYAPVDAYLEKLNQLEGSAVGPRSSVPYVKGKYYFFRKRYDDAIAALQTVPKGSPYWFQAQYFIGASLIGQQRFGEAVQTFDPLARTPAKTDVEKKIVELAHLALGRIYYDQGQLAVATIEYSKIPNTSDAFTDALYESAWVAIKDKFYQKAYRALDLLLTAQPDGPQVPEIKLLMGNLEIRQEAWEDATKAFTKTRDEFDVVKKEMSDRAKSENEGPAYFKGLLQKSPGKFDFRKALPENAARFVPNDPELDKLQSVLGDLADVRKAIGDSDDTIARIEKAIDGPARVNIFPELAAARGRALETANTITELETKLLAAERRIVDPVAGGERGELDSLGRTRQALEKQLEAMPRAQDSYKERILKARQSFDELDKRAVELNVVIQSHAAERVAIEKYFRDTGQDADPEKRAAFDVQMADAQKADAELSAAYDSLRRDIAEAANAIGVDDSQMQREAALKKELDDTVAREHAVLDALRSRLDGGSRGQTDRIEALLDRARADATAIVGFNRRIDEIVDEKLRNVRSVLTEEKANFGKYRTTETDFGGQSSDVGGEILAESFRKLIDRFYGIVVRADVGIIDVAWALKQTRTDENSRLVREKKRELKLLDDDFKDVLKE